MSFVVVSDICCEISYDYNLIIILFILVMLIQFDFSFIQTQFQSWTCKMAEAGVGEHWCDAWTVFSDCSAFKAPNVIK